MKRRRAGQLRIIGGQWRGRKLPVPEGSVRPSSDRVRETLFNWLTPSLPGARCLDLFAGTGALGLEALSRGANEAVLVEHDRHIAETLRRNLHNLHATGGQVAAVDALTYLRGLASPFEIVFLDPPYWGDLLAPCCQTLAERGWLAASAYVYIEAHAGTGLPALPAGWALSREGRAGQCHYSLLRAHTATETQD
ncbi:MAG: 16S rRNA (guanine(966)-N(2))-methyltransferase RsmD [Halorhodospira sp.]